ncbi:MAG: ATP-dependent DNA helicase [Desulfobacterales bacterium]|nr:ATP-dependent DNA helicase [Desulfobacterales bacterium]
MPKTSLTVEDILGPKGLLKKSLPGFEFRDSQLQMALLIRKALLNKVPTIVEAGTGTGKTFGYLIPIILSNKKAVISTGTKNLQEQVFFKDIPLLQEAVPSSKIDAMIMKGRKNYLCLYRYRQLFPQQSLFKGRQASTKQKLEKWLTKTEFADRAELTWLADDEVLWDTLSCTSDQCLGADCMFLDECYLGRLRSRAARAKVIIVNHHLFFADMKVKRGGFGEIIPRFQVAVFDEAHDIEETATNYLGESLSTNQLMELAGDIEKELKNLKDINKGKLKRHLNALKAATEALRGIFLERDNKGRLDHDTLSTISEGPAREISRELKSIKKKASPNPDNTLLEAGMGEGRGPLQQFASRADELDQLLEQIMTPRDPNWLTWYEKRKRALVIHASPLEISERMNELLYKKIQSTVFTSATLSAGGSFNYIRSRLGLSENTLEGLYLSHFDFENQALMYIPKDLPSPDKPDFALKIARRIKEILDMTGGRALVLFTSYRNLNLVCEALEDMTSYTIHRQGNAPRSVLLDAFRHDVHSILLGTGSFWQGVDVPGESLSCLIVDKLPFASPFEPLVAARIDAIRDRGGNPFMEYQVPSAIISLKQGLGRLIRKNSDRGIMSLLDTRVITRKYGSLFLDSLPKVSVSHDLEDIGRFFK